MGKNISDNKKDKNEYAKSKPFSYNKTLVQPISKSLLRNTALRQQAHRINIENVTEKKNCQNQGKPTRWTTTVMVKNINLSYYDGTVNILWIDLRCCRRDLCLLHSLPEFYNIKLHCTSLNTHFILKHTAGLIFFVSSTFYRQQHSSEGNVLVKNDKQSYCEYNWIALDNSHTVNTTE